jgi:hypothetical protein
MSERVRVRGLLRTVLCFRTLAHTYRTTTASTVQSGSYHVKMFNSTTGAPIIAENKRGIQLFPSAQAQALPGQQWLVSMCGEDRGVDEEDEGKSSMRGTELKKLADGLGTL